MAFADILECCSPAAAIGIAVIIDFVVDIVRMIILANVSVRRNHNETRKNTPLIAPFVARETATIAPFECLALSEIGFVFSNGLWPFGQLFASLAHRERDSIAKFCCAAH